jgi:hypothetical protein
MLTVGMGWPLLSCEGRRYEEGHMSKLSILTSLETTECSPMTRCSAMTGCSPMTDYLAMADWSSAMTD